MQRFANRESQCKIELSLLKQSRAELRRKCESLLILTCPVCPTQWFDWDGCALLTCSSHECNTSFCAICLITKTKYDENPIYGDDFHDHIQKCSRETHQLLTSKGIQLTPLDLGVEFYLTPELIVHVRNIGIIKNIHKFLRTISYEDRLFCIDEIIYLNSDLNHPAYGLRD